MEYESIARRRLTTVLVLVGLIVIALFAGLFVGLDGNLILRRYAAHHNTNAAEQVSCDTSPDSAQCVQAAAPDNAANATAGPTFVVPALAPTLIPSLTLTFTSTPLRALPPPVAPKKSPTRAPARPPSSTSTPVPSPTVLVANPTSAPVPTDGPCSGDINGYVLTSDGTVVTNVNVNLTGGGYANTVATDQDGFYEFANLSSGTFTLVAAPAAGSGFTSPPAMTLTVTNCAFIGQDLTLISAATATPTSITAATATLTITPTSSATATLTPTPTQTVSVSPTATATRTPTSTPTGTATRTGTPTPSSTRTPSPTASPSATPSPSGTPAGQTITFVAAADAYVNQASLTRNYGTSTALRTDGSPIVNSYLRFSIVGLTGTVKKATLRIYANSGSGSGFTIRSVADNTWGESTITYSNAPAFSSTALGATGAFGTGVWTTVDVTAYITGNGTFSLALSSTGAQINLASRESGANAPQLVITYGP